MARLLASCVAAGCCLAWLLGGCNAVLGIDEAHPWETPASGGSSTGGTGAVQPGTFQKNIFCDTVKPDCSACLTASCTTDLATCLSNEPCRNAFQQYRECLGSEPTCGAGSDLCLEQLASHPGADAVKVCASECASTCMGSNLVSLCELYCACMSKNCPDEIGGDCVASCQKEKPADIYCRLDHCDFAELSLSHKAAHCGHAVGVDECPRPNVKKNCDNKQASGLTCSRHEDCCSGDCQIDAEICN